MYLSYPSASPTVHLITLPYGQPACHSYVQQAEMFSGRRETRPVKTVRRSRPVLPSMKGTDSGEYS